MERWQTVDSRYNLVSERGRYFSIDREFDFVLFIIVTASTLWPDMCVFTLEVHFLWNLFIFTKAYVDAMRQSLKTPNLTKNVLYIFWSFDISEFIKWFESDKAGLTGRNGLAEPGNSGALKIFCPYDFRYFSQESFRLGSVERRFSHYRKNSALCHPVRLYYGLRDSYFYPILGNRYIC